MDVLIATARAMKIAPKFAVCQDNGRAIPGTALMQEHSGTGKSLRQAPAAGAAGRSAAIEATLLLGKWTRIAGGHVSLGTRCSCGAVAGAANVRVQDYEVRILDFLFGKHAGAAAEPVLAVLRARAGYRPRVAGSVTELLRAIATDAPDSAAELKLALLSDLQRSIDSFEVLHRG